MASIAENTKATKQKWKRRRKGGATMQQIAVT